MEVTLGGTKIKSSDPVVATAKNANVLDTAKIVNKIMSLYWSGKDVEAKKMWKVNANIKDAITGYMKANGMRADNMDRILSNSVSSRNSVVAKALNAVAKNFSPTSEFKKGDIVRFRDSVRWADHDETYTVSSFIGGDVVIKDKSGRVSRDDSDVLELVKSSRNAVVAKAHELEKLCKALRAEFGNVREEVSDAWDDNNVPAQVFKAFKDTRETLHDLYNALDDASRTLFML